MMPFSAEIATAKQRPENFNLFGMKIEEDLSTDQTRAA